MPVLFFGIAAEISYHPVPLIVVTNFLPPYQIWRQAVMMGVASHLYRLIGPKLANLYVSILNAIILSIVGLHNAMKLREKLYSERLTQQFKQLREHQQWTADQHGDNTYIVSQAVKICEAMEFQSLLSYPHEHTKHCTKDCMLRHADMFIIFGN